jgi:hypothetical protein
LEVAELVRLIAAQAQRGEQDCGYFLGELLPALHKSQGTLAKANPTFQKRRQEIHTAPFATAKDSRFRGIVEQIIRGAQAQKRRQHIFRRVPGAELVLKPNEKLLLLPEFGDSEQAINAWTDVVVYPQLRRKQRELRSLFERGELQKAKDQNGKFQVSRLEPLARATVARIAKVPRVYFFNVG